MVRTVMAANLIVITSFGAFGQSAGTPTFEAASIKPAPPPTPGMMLVGMSGGPGSKDPGRINYSNVSLKDLARRAFDLKDYQISGPDWFNSVRFDVVATLPPNSTKEQFQLMLQNLLAERFKMTVHREKKELPVYALVVGKNGPKLKESVEDPVNTADGKAGGVINLPAGGPSAVGSGGGFGGGRGGSASFNMSVGGPGGGGRSGIMMNGRGHLQANKTTVTSFADVLARQLDRPVIDMTELKGNYDFTLDYAPDESMQNAGMKMGMPMPMPRPEGGEGRGPADGASENSAPSLFTAVQNQLGLKLDARKAPLDFLVIDHLEKVPTEN